MRCGVQLCLRSYTLPVGRCSALSDLRGAGELPGQTECASVASPAVDEELSGTDRRKDGREDGRKREEGKKEGGRNGRKEQLEGAVASRAGRRGAEGGWAGRELRPPSTS